MKTIPIFIVGENTNHGSTVSVATSIQFRPGIVEVVADVATVFSVTVDSILKAKRGTNNVPRWVAMHLSQVAGGQQLTSIAVAFNLTRTGSIPITIGKLKLLMENDRKLCKRVESLMSDR